MTARPQATTNKPNAHNLTAKHKMAAGQGMYLLVSPSGSKLWRAEVWHGGKEKTLSFGAYPDVTLARAG